MRSQKKTKTKTKYHHGPFLRKLLKDVLHQIKGKRRKTRRSGTQDTGTQHRREEKGSVRLTGYNRLKEKLTRWERRMGGLQERFSRKRKELTDYRKHLTM